MRRSPPRVFVPLLGVLALAIVAPACSGGAEDGGGPTTTTSATTTTLPRPTGTSTTLPANVPTEVDVCNLVNEEELSTVLDDAGPGEVTITMPEVEPGEAPPLLTGQCAWPTVDEAAFTLYYLGPTTARSGTAHLQDVLALEPEFAREATVQTLTSGAEEVGLLIDADGKLREVAVAKRSALLYLVVEQDVDATDTAALQAYADLIRQALVRAPR
jgi:hypothetical protein